VAAILYDLVVKFVLVAILEKFLGRWWQSLVYGTNRAMVRAARGTMTGRGLATEVTTHERRALA
jgi:hypothetical protein